MEVEYLQLLEDRQNRQFAKIYQVSSGPFVEVHVSKTLLGRLMVMAPNCLVGQNSARPAESSDHRNTASHQWEIQIIRDQDIIYLLFWIS